MYARRSQGLGQVQLVAEAGQIAGGLLGGLFGGKSYPTQTLNVNTPGGQLQIVFSGAGPVQGSAQYVFTQWAQAGHFDWLASIANTGSGPKWDNPSATYTGYGQVDRNFAAQLVAAYQRATDNVTGAPLVPAGTAVVPYTAGQPAPAPGAAAAAGMSPLLAVGIGAAALAAVFMATGGRRQNRRRRQNPSSRHRRRSHRRRGRRRR